MTGVARTAGDAGTPGFRVPVICPPSRSFWGHPGPAGLQVHPRSLMRQAALGLKSLWGACETRATPSGLGAMDSIEPPCCMLGTPAGGHAFPIFPILTHSPSAVALACQELLPCMRLAAHARSQCTCAPRYAVGP